MGLLDGKRILITGVLTDDSLAFGVARLAQEQGAEIVLTGAGRGVSLTTRTAKRLPAPAEVLAMDVTVPAEIDAVAETLRERWGSIDGVLHAIAFAPEICLGGELSRAEWDDVAVALRVSSFSLMALTRALRPLLEASGRASVVGLDFDASLAWPGYDWMGVAKASLESLTRYLARDLGPGGTRVNLVAAGPIRTMAARSVPGFELFEEVWDGRAPLGWDVRDSSAVARACVALLSDWFPATTGEIVHVDGGFHAIGA